MKRCGRWDMFCVVVLTHRGLYLQSRSMSLTVCRKLGILRGKKRCGKDIERCFGDVEWVESPWTGNPVLVQGILCENVWGIHNNIQYDYYKSIFQRNMKYMLCGIVWVYKKRGKEVCRLLKLLGVFHGLFLSWNISIRIKLHLSLTRAVSPSRHRL